MKRYATTIELYEIMKFESPRHGCWRILESNTHSYFFASGVNCVAATHKLATFQPLWIASISYLAVAAILSLAGTKIYQPIHSFFSFLLNVH